MPRLTFGETVRDFRKLRGFTQETLAEALGVDQALISMWERDTRMPPTKRLVQLAHVLRVPPSALLDAIHPPVEDAS